tara:strand:- start:429 stop:587 length:159 start_codon:yes stop_codon:yes gene_type:complete
MRSSFFFSVAFSCALAAMKKQSKDITVNNFIIYLDTFCSSGCALKKLVDQGS